MDISKLPDLGFSWEEVWQTVQTTGVDFAFNLVKAIIIFYVGKFIVSVIVRTVRRIMAKQDIEDTLENFVLSLLRMVLMLFVIIATVGALGMQTTSFVAVLGAAGLAIGLALQGSLSNFASGVLIVLFKPYRVGDWVEAGGISGAVERVEILTTVFNTGDNKKVIVPNGQVMGSIITNYSANPQRRVDMVVGVSYDDDLDKVRATLEELIAADDRVLSEPPHKIAVSELGDSSVNFIVRPWVKTEDYWGVMFDLTEAIKKRFDKEGISFPFPQQDVHLYKASAD